jgi:hypothetical protein
VNRNNPDHTGHDLLRWKPTVSAGANFRMVDFLRFAEVDPVSRGQ